MAQLTITIAEHFRLDTKSDRKLQKPLRKRGRKTVVVAEITKDYLWKRWKYGTINRKGKQFDSQPLRDWWQSMDNR